MPIVTIDDQKIEVPGGATILDAAKKLGIEIPTLCYLKGYDPSTSCLVCIVKNRQTGQFVTSCSTKAMDGMHLDSGTDEVRSMRRTALELILSEHVGDCLAPCFFACPAHMDIPLMLRQIGEKDLPDAIATIKHDIALPAVLGRVCSKPCEKGCRRKDADDPVAVCELKRFVADSDLASDSPYLPTCPPDTGKRVAIVGTGPTGLAAAYYLRQLGHACVFIDKASEAGGQLRMESPDLLPPKILEGEIQQVLRLGVETRWQQDIANRQQLDELTREFDAVLLACGPISQEQIVAFGLTATRRGIKTRADTYQTEREKVFAAGNAVRGKAMVVRRVADGREAAQTMDHFLSGREVRGPGRPFSSRITRIGDDEMNAFLDNAESSCLEMVDTGHEFESEEAVDQSSRCLECGCSAHGTCKLERYAIEYGADSTHYAGERRPYEVIGRNSQVLFEPGKCIKCELCVKIAAAAGEPIGLSFVGRGFDVELAVPFDASMDEALTQVAQQCVSACPTAALSFSRKNLVQLGLLSIGSPQQSDVVLEEQS